MLVSRPSSFVLLSMILATVPLPAQSHPEWAPRAVAAIAAQCERDGIPGLSCAIGVGGEIPFVHGHGEADVENGVAANGATVYRLASISKPITAVCALRLAEQGKLDLDRDVAAIVPGWPAKRWPVTTRQLLGHLGGVRHYLPGEGESTVHFADQGAALGRFADDALLHEPGTKYLYSTYGFNLVAAAVERAAGASFPAVVQELVAGPSGAGTLQDDDVGRIVPGRAQGYVRRGGELRNSVLMDSSYKLGGGGLCCSAPDLVRFAQALVDGRLLGRESLQAMWTAQRLADGTDTGYGLGFRVAEHDGRRAVLHSGAQSRVSTMLYVLPDDGVVVALLCNLEGVRLGALARRLAAMAVPTAR